MASLPSGNPATAQGEPARAEPAFPARVERDFPAVAPRVLIVGLDGATFDVLSPLMADGHMPRLNSAVDGGVWGPLTSTTPPITPSAWTTFLTGKHPGLHRILDFEGYDVEAGLLRFNSARSIRDTRNLWSILGERGFRVGSINVPLSYPPQQVHGFMISGFDAPGPRSQFAWPASLREPILQRWSDPTCGKNWRRKLLGGLPLFRENVAYMVRSFRQGAEMTRWCGDEFGWDVLMVVLKLVDNLQHKTWKHIDPRWRDRDPARRDIVVQAFMELDRAVGDLLDYAREHDAAVVMVSDHGHGSLEGKVYPNRLLADWGYLKLRGPLHRAAREVRRKLGLGGNATPNGQGQVEHHLPVNLSQSRACVMHAGMAGFLYINLKGRQPGGIVEPGEYESLRGELRERLVAVRMTGPQGREFQLFPAVHRPEDLYGCTREAEPWLPDLMLIQHDSLSVARRLRGRKVVDWLPYRKLEGTHRFNGIFIACGPGIARGRRVSAHIVDCAPTILALCGLKIPPDMQGRVIMDAFEKPPRVELASAAATGGPVTTDRASAPDHGYDERELAVITDRLADLGYLE